MTAQKLFIILILLFITLGVVWYTFIYQPLQLESKQIHLKLAEFNVKLKNARSAKRQLEFIEKRLELCKDNLATEQSRISDRNNLSYVTEELRRVSAKYDLKITDFTPVLDTYFETIGNELIKPLPIIITVSGCYLNIGKFLEHWEKLNFYLTLHEFIIEKLNPQDNKLTATITCNLYTWNR